MNIEGKISAIVVLRSLIKDSIHRTASNIYYQDTILGEMVMSNFEKFNSCHMPWYIWRPVSINTDNIKILFDMFQSPTSILDVDIEI